MFFNINLTKEKPLECIPFDGIARIRSPDLTLFLLNIFFLDTMPTLNPAKSNLSLE